MGKKEMTFLRENAFIIWKKNYLLVLVNFFKNFVKIWIPNLRSGGPSSLFRVPPKKKNKTPDHSLFFRCGYMATLFSFFFFIIDSVIFNRVAVSIVHDC